MLEPDYDGQSKAGGNWFRVMNKQRGKRTKQESNLPSLIETLYFNVFQMNKSAFSYCSQNSPIRKRC
jgi:hypothetical protein